VIKRLRTIIEGTTGQKMLGPNHLETVFRTTTQLAYGVGRRTAQEEAADYLPVWEYQAVGDDRTRPTHMALDGLQYPVNHPFWDSYYPPWEWRCRCSVIPVLDYRKNYDPKKPNSQSSVDLDDDGIPIRANVSGTPVRIEKSDFSGVPRQTNLEQVLKTGAERALDSRGR
jgi:SPP1 gp7 family putative phage head morphogenesis protein